MLGQWVVTGGQGEEEEILLRSHEVMRIHRRDGIGREESFLVLFPLSLLPYFPLHSILHLSLFLLSYVLLILSLLSENVLLFPLVSLYFPALAFFPSSSCSSFLNYFPYSRMLWT